VTATRTLRAIARGLRRHPSLLINAVLLLLIGTAGVWRGASVARATPPVPADLFIQSIATEDGDLGWNQLCPALRQQLPRESLEQLTASQRTIASDRGMTLSVEHVGDRPRPSGGEIRFYVATLHTADGEIGQKTYVITTQASGCVESIQ
jgi:hypothetical protein